MKERWLWLVRLIGVVVFLVLMYLLMSLHAELVKMNEEKGTGGKPVGSLHSDCELRIADCGSAVEATEA